MCPVSRVLCLVVSFMLILSAGALGLVGASECEKLPLIDYQNRMSCYHYAAASIASVAQPGNEKARNDAKALCRRIIDDIASRSDIGDASTRAYTEADLCYTDIAKSLRDPTICNELSKKTFGSSITGSGTNRELCVQQATQLKKIEQSSYITGQQSMCNLSFIFPVLLAAVFYCIALPESSAKRESKNKKIILRSFQLR